MRCEGGEKFKYIEANTRKEISSCANTKEIRVRIESICWRDRQVIGCPIKTHPPPSPASPLATVLSIRMGRYPKSITVYLAWNFVSGATSMITFSLSIGAANQWWCWAGVYGGCLTHHVEKVLPGKWREIELSDGIFWIPEATWTPGTIQLCESINYFVLKLVPLGFIYWTNQPPLPNPANFPQDNRYQQLVSISSFRSFLNKITYTPLRWFHTPPITGGAWFPLPRPLWAFLPILMRSVQQAGHLTDWPLFSTDAHPWDTATCEGQTGIPATASAESQFGASASHQTREWVSLQMIPGPGGCQVSTDSCTIQPTQITDS